MITNGTIKYGETVKTGDYENKRVDVELSFTMTDDADVDATISMVTDKARAHAIAMLHNKPAAVKAAEEPKPAARGRAAPKLPGAKASPHAAEEAALAADLSKGAEVVEEPSAVPAYLKSEVLDPKTGKPLTKAADPAAVEDDGLGDLLGTDAAKEITDKELTDATQKCQAANKNSPAIRVALKAVGVVSPPGRIIDIPQDKRQQYLDELLKVKPLA